MTTPPTKADRQPRRPKVPTTRPTPARPRAEPPPGRVTLAAVAGAHGLGGEVKLKLFTDDLARYRSFNGGTLTLVSVRGTIARFAEVADRMAAEALRGTPLCVARDELPPLADGEYYHADLIGLPVVTPDDAAVGRVVEVANFGAGDVIEIERVAGGLFMVPMRPEAVVDWNAERLVLSPDFAAG